MKFILLILWSSMMLASAAEVVVYTSQDQVFAESLFERFTRETGIKVKAVFDSEAVKTVGLVNRLFEERRNPRCDLFWNNEAVRTHQLANAHVLAPPIIEFGFRSRRIVVNTNLLSLSNAPVDILELTNRLWKGKLVMAYPLFGTTSTYLQVLRRLWGKAEWEKWLNALKENEPLLVDGNSVVVRLVGKGEVPIGLTDWDDIAAGQRQGLPVAAQPLGSHSLLIPNTAAITQGARRPKEAEELLRFLQKEETVASLVRAGALESVSLPGAVDFGLKADWSGTAEALPEAVAVLKRLFLR